MAALRVQPIDNLAVDGPLIFDSGAMAVDAASAGLGIGELPSAGSDGPPSPAAQELLPAIRLATRLRMPKSRSAIRS